VGDSYCLPGPCREAGIALIEDSLQPLATNDSIECEVPVSVKPEKPQNLRESSMHASGWTIGDTCLLLTYPERMSREDSYDCVLKLAHPRVGSPADEYRAAVIEVRIVVVVVRGCCETLRIVRSQRIEGDDAVLYWAHPRRQNEVRSRE
jgi:hypothetical protein